MSEGPVIAAMLETGDSFLHLEGQEINEETAEKLGYRPEKTVEYDEYVSKALDSSIDQDMINYHTLAQRLIEEPQILYEENLLRPETYEQVEKHLDLLRSNRDRSLNISEIQAVINTTMDEANPFPRKAIDKEKLLENIYIGVYDNLREDITQENHRGHIPG